MATLSTFTTMDWGRDRRTARWRRSTGTISSGVRPRAAYRVHDQSLYVGRLVQNRSGSWVMLGFHNVGPDGTFIGEIIDPIPVHRDAGRLELL